MSLISLVQSRAYYRWVSPRCSWYDVMIVFQTLSSESSSPLEHAILSVENQVLIHILLEKLACELYLGNEQTAQVCQSNPSWLSTLSLSLSLSLSLQLFKSRDDINHILNDHRTGGGSEDGGHGLMLTIHMLRWHRSVHTIHRLLVTRYDDLCRDYTCLESLHCRIQQDEVSVPTPVTPN